MRDADSTSYRATLEAVTVFADLVDAEAQLRGADRIRQLVVLGDGATAITVLRPPTCRHPSDPHQRR